MAPRRKSSKTAAKRPRSNNSISSSSSSEEDDYDALQRFSNTSAHPRRSRASHHRSPPLLSATPPPSPPGDPTENGEGDEDQRDFYLRTERGYLMRAVTPPGDALDGARRRPPPSLLAALLQAEAERAGAAESARHAPLAPTLSHPSSALPSPQAFYGSSMLTSAPTPLSLSDVGDAASAEAVTVHIGVVPLPGSKTGELPWLRALRAAADASVREASEGVQHSSSPTTTAEVDIDVANLRLLRPWRLPLRSPSVSSLFAVARNDASNTSTPQWRKAEESYTSATTPSATAAAVAEAVVGWSGVFADLSLVLPGAQPVVSCAPFNRAEGSEGTKDGLAAGAQVCRGAATAMLMLS